MDKALLRYFKPDIFILSTYFLVVMTCLVKFGPDIFGLPFTKVTPFFASEGYLISEEAQILGLTEKGQATGKAIIYTMVFQTTFLNLLVSLMLIKFGNRYGKFVRHKGLGNDILK